ncbi:MAG: hypothetical protein AB7H88_10530 [Vicinamibacterales bacterium]
MAEWVVALAAFGAVGWMLYGPIQGWLGQPPAALVETVDPRPDGVPAAATPVALLVFLDGRELRVGDPTSTLNALVDETMADGPPQVTQGPFGDRQLRAYERDGTRFFVVSERTEPGGPVRVSGIYLR